VPWGGEGEDSRNLLQLVPERQANSDYPQHISFLTKKRCWPAGRVVAKFPNRFSGLYSGKM